MNALFIVQTSVGVWRSEVFECSL